MADDHPDDHPHIEPADRAHLHAFKDTAEAQRLQEMQGDADLLERIMWTGYKGDDFNKIMKRLLKYGLTVMNSWCKSGAIFERCAERGRPVRRRQFDPDVAESIAGEVITEALVSFRDKVLIPKVWDPSKGASLDTFFIGHCLLLFPNIYRREFNTNYDHLPVTRYGKQIEGEDAPDPSHRTTWDDPARIVENRSLVVEAYAADRNKKLDAVMRCILVGRAADKSNKEIADLCGISVPVVKTRLHRYEKEQGVA